MWSNHYLQGVQRTTVCRIGTTHYSLSIGLETTPLCLDICIHLLKKSLSPNEQHKTFLERVELQRTKMCNKCDVKHGIYNKCSHMTIAIIDKLFLPRSLLNIANIAKLEQRLHIHIQNPAKRCVNELQLKLKCISPYLFLGLTLVHLDK